MAVEKSLFARHDNSWDLLIKSLCATIPLLQTRLQTADACWPKPLAIAAIPYGYINQFKSEKHPGLFPLGDQMAVIPSFCGDGMAIALHSAFMATEGDTSEYAENLRKELAPQMRAAKCMQIIMARRLPSILAVKLIQIMPSFFTFMVRRTRLKQVAFNKPA